MASRDVNPPPPRLCGNQLPLLYHIAHRATYPRQGFGTEARDRTRLHTRRGLMWSLVDFLYFLYNKIRYPLSQGWRLMSKLVPEFRVLEFVLKVCAKSLNNLVMKKHEDRNRPDAEYALRVQQQFQGNWKRATLRPQTCLLLAIAHRHDRLQSTREHWLQQSKAPPKPAAARDALVCFKNWFGTTGCENGGLRPDDPRLSVSSSKKSSMNFLDVVNLDDIPNFPSPPDKIKSTGQPCVYCARPLERSKFERKNWM